MVDDKDVSPGREPLTLLTIPQAAEVLSCHRATVYKLIADGDLPVTNIATSKAANSGKQSPRIRRDALDAFIESRTRSAKDLRRPRR